MAELPPEEREALITRGAGLMEEDLKKIPTSEQLEDIRNGPPETFLALPHLAEKTREEAHKAYGTEPPHSPEQLKALETLRDETIAGWEHHRKTIQDADDDTKVARAQRAQAFIHKETQKHIVTQQAAHHAAHSNPITRLIHRPFSRCELEGSSFRRSWWYGPMLALLCFLIVLLIIYFMLNPGKGAPSEAPSEVPSEMPPGTHSFPTYGAHHPDIPQDYHYVQAAYSASLAPHVSYTSPGSYVSYGAHSAPM
jgi:hypothetical protein